MAIYAYPDRTEPSSDRSLFGMAGFLTLLPAGRIPNVIGE